jgi:hypothetical protein
MRGDPPTSLSHINVDNFVNILKMKYILKYIAVHVLNHMQQSHEQKQSLLAFDSY